MPYFVRPRNSGRTFELRVKHCRLPKPVYRNFDLQEDAQRAGRDAVAALDRGEMPSWLERSERRALVTISQAIVAYRGIRAVPPSGGLPAAVSSAAETAGGNPPSMRAHALVRARSPVSCARYSACLGENEEHQFVTYRFAGSYGDFRGAVAVHRMKTRTTPVSQTKTQALARVLASVTHGYTRVCTGTVPPERLSALAAKFDERYRIANTKGQRVLNKRAGRANALFVACAPPDEYRVENERFPWMLLATSGEGVETERWQDVRDRPVWLDYQLCRHNDAGEVRWTWRRTSVEMTQLYAELGEDLARRRHDQVARKLQHIANQPGFQIGRAHV